MSFSGKLHEAYIKIWNNVANPTNIISLMRKFIAMNEWLFGTFSRK